MKKALGVVLACIVNLVLLVFVVALVLDHWRQIATVAAWMMSGAVNAEFLAIVFVIVLVEMHDHARRKNLWAVCERIEDLNYELKKLRGDVTELSRKVAQNEYQISTT
jgi:cell division protein FtsB